MKEIDIYVQEAQRVPNKMDAKRHTPRHILIKMPKVKDKERIFKAAREKQLVTYNGCILTSFDYCPWFKQRVVIGESWKLIL